MFIFQLSARLWSFDPALLSLPVLHRVSKSTHFASIHFPASFLSLRSWHMPFDWTIFCYWLNRIWGIFLGTKHWLLCMFIGMQATQASYILPFFFLTPILDCVTVQLTQVLQICFRIINKCMKSNYPWYITTETMYKLLKLYITSPELSVFLNTWDIVYSFVNLHV